MWVNNDDKTNYDDNIKGYENGTEQERGGYGKYET